MKALTIAKGGRVRKTTTMTTSKTLERKTPWHRWIHTLFTACMSQVVWRAITMSIHSRTRRSKSRITTVGLFPATPTHLRTLSTVTCWWTMDFRTSSPRRRRRLRQTSTQSSWERCSNGTRGLSLILPHRRMSQRSSESQHTSTAESGIWQIKRYVLHDCICEFMGKF